MFRPPYLKAGDKVALVSPAGAIESSYITHAAQILQQWELEPVIGQYAHTRHAYFAGTDKERLHDMQWALDNEEIRAIFCNRGGYGCMRIVEHLDYSTFQGAPKWVIGFSDITVFHAKLNTLGIESLHAPMPKSFLNTTPEALLRLQEFLFGQISPYQIPPHPFNKEGVVRAELTGGNLTLLHCLRSSSLECKHQNPILFIEDVGENLYAIDRMLQSLKLSSKFKHLQGVIVGDFTEMKGVDFGKSAYEIIQEALQDCNFPICFGFPAGHSANNFPLIIGSTIEMEVTSQGSIITFLNS